MPDPKPADKKQRAKPQPNRFMLVFGTKYASTHAQIVKDAEADDREPGEYLVRWLAKYYEDGKVGETA